MMTLYWTTLQMMLMLSPSESSFARHGALATAIAETVAWEGPLFKNDSEGLRTASLMVSVAFRESSLNPEAVGDQGDSFCAFQIHKSSGGTPLLLEDPHQCALYGYRMLKESIRVDRTHPIAHYARGPHFASLEAQRISNDRMALSRWLTNAIR